MSSQIQKSTSSSTSSSSSSTTPQQLISLPSLSCSLSALPQAKSVDNVSLHPTMSAQRAAESEAKVNRTFSCRVRPIVILFGCSAQLRKALSKSSSAHGSLPPAYAPVVRIRAELELRIRRLTRRASVTSPVVLAGLELAAIDDAQAYKTKDPGLNDDSPLASSLLPLHRSSALPLFPSSHTASSGLCSLQHSLPFKSSPSHLIVLRSASSLDVSLFRSYLYRMASIFASVPASSSRPRPRPAYALSSSTTSTLLFVHIWLGLLVSNSLFAFCVATGSLQWIHPFSAASHRRTGTVCLSAEHRSASEASTIILSVSRDAWCQRRWEPLRDWLYRSGVARATAPDDHGSPVSGARWPWRLLVVRVPAGGVGSGGNEQRATSMTSW
ncbi:hypothetical protein B0H21DRAFT_721155 [Amylocystis lapponica]|nr:hypothetical protein B0H21DRAFT_721155 [Amylocystis lapponica]